jgi:branched-chain amino acid transport system substrate-binding protein
MGAAGADRVKYVGLWNVNNETYAGREIVEAFKKKYNDDYYIMQTFSVVTMFSQAIKTAKSTNPVKVAFALEGMKAKSLNGDIEMRASDHQMLQPLYIATWSKTNSKDVRFDQENTGYGWKTDVKVPTYIASQPTSCQMKRPAKS